MTRDVPAITASFRRFTSARTKLKTEETIAFDDAVCTLCLLKEDHSEDVCGVLGVARASVHDDDMPTRKPDGAR
jgi:hypothetical protein